MKWSSPTDNDYIQQKKHFDDIFCFCCVSHEGFCRLVKEEGKLIKAPSFHSLFPFHLIDVYFRLAIYLCLREHWINYCDRDERLNMRWTFVHGTTAADGTLNYHPSRRLSFLSMWWIIERTQILCSFRHIASSTIVNGEFLCFVTASRLIRRRVPAAGHLMTPRRLWLNKIPTQCDVVVEFPGKCYCCIIASQSSQVFRCHRRQCTRRGTSMAVK